MAIMTHAKCHFNWLMLTSIFSIWASEPPPGPGDRLKRPGLIGLILCNWRLETYNVFLMICNSHLARYNICLIIYNLLLKRYNNCSLN